VRRYPEVKLTRVPGVPGHMVVDPETRTVFIADTGGGRVVAVDADSGRYVDEARNDLGSVVLTLHPKN
jgi:sugar lactone lactonase YvrE